MHKRLVKQNTALSLFLVGLMASLPCIANAQATSKQVTAIATNWQFSQRGAGEEHWLPAEVPGDVHLDLLHNKLIPDPYYRDNESKLQWIEDANWSYKTTIDVTPDTLRRAHVELVFNGLDTTAHVLLNGDKILDANNMFRPWRVDVKSRLHVGKNDLRVDFDAPGKVAADLAAKDKTHDLTGIPEKAYLRKAAYEYGWDWGPKFVTNGIWQPVALEAASSATPTTRWATWTEMSGCEIWTFSILA